jgi:signal transduction histidine kinase
MSPPAEPCAATDLAEPAAVGPRRPELERDLLSSVCHDLKEPLASIVMGTGFLRKLLPENDPTALKIVEAIQRAATRMGHRISTFSDLARLEAHDLELDVRPYDVAAILQAALEQFLPDATARRVSVSLELDHDVPTLQLTCDRDRLLQVLRHLCVCALSVVSERARIVIRATTDTAEVLRLEVAAKQPPASGRIAVALPRPELAIARGLIELHGGCLAVASDADSVSLSFTLRAPRAEPEAARGDSGSGQRASL